MPEVQCKNTQFPPSPLHLPIQAKRDAALARSLQKDELSSIMDISDDFLAELRLNMEFNRILAKGGRRTARDWP